LTSCCSAAARHLETDDQKVAIKWAWMFLGPLHIVLFELVHALADGGLNFLPVIHAGSDLDFIVFATSRNIEWKDKIDCLS